MKKIITRVASVLVLGVASSPVFATGEFPATEIPVPGVLALFGIGALAIYVVNRFKK